MMYSGTKTARDGSLVPLFMDGTPMHSLYAPERDARAFASQFGHECGFAIVGGAGNCMHIAALQRARPDMRILCVEESEEDVLFIKSHFSVPHGVALCTAGKLEPEISQRYVPALHGDIEFHAVRSWAAHASSMRAAQNAISAALRRFSADYSVQAHFGAQWHRNILLNMRHCMTHGSRWRETLLGAARKKMTAAVIAAGPSLDHSAAELTRGRGSYFIIAADTAWRALARRGIRCDAVVSVDGQLLSGAHFAPFGIPERNDFCKDCIFVFDLSASHDAVKRARRLGGQIAFSHNSHPLSVLAAQSCGSLVPLETGAGTVTIAAAALAVAAGFETVRMFGADFSYGDGKAYTSGTYLHDLYSARQHRLHTLESQFAALMLRTPLLTRSGVPTTEVLQGYRASLEDFMRRNMYARDGARMKNAGAGRSLKEEPRADSGDFCTEYPARLRKAIASFKDGSLDFMQSAELRSLLPLLAALRARLKNPSLYSLLQLAYSRTLRYTVKETQ